MRCCAALVAWWWWCANAVEDGTTVLRQVERCAVASVVGGSVEKGVLVVSGTTAKRAVAWEEEGSVAVPSEGGVAKAVEIMAWAAKNDSAVEVATAAAATINDAVAALVAADDWIEARERSLAAARRRAVGITRARRREALVREVHRLAQLAQETAAEAREAWKRAKGRREPRADDGAREAVRAADVDVGRAGAQLRDLARRLSQELGDRRLENEFVRPEFDLELRIAAAKEDLFDAEQARRDLRAAYARLPRPTRKLEYERRTIYAPFLYGSPRPRPNDAAGRVDVRSGIAALRDALLLARAAPTSLLRQFLKREAWAKVTDYFAPKTMTTEPRLDTPSGLLFGAFDQTVSEANATLRRLKCLTPDNTSALAAALGLFSSRREAAFRAKAKLANLTAARPKAVREADAAERRAEAVHLEHVGARADLRRLEETHDEIPSLDELSALRAAAERDPPIARFEDDAAAAARRLEAAAALGSAVEPALASIAAEMRRAAETLEARAPTCPEPNRTRAPSRVFFALPAVRRFKLRTLLHNARWVVTADCGHSRTTTLYTLDSARPTLGLLLEKTGTALLLAGGPPPASSTYWPADAAWFQPPP